MVSTTAMTQIAGCEASKKILKSIYRHVLHSLSLIQEEVDCVVPMKRIVSDIQSRHKTMPPGLSEEIVEKIAKQFLPPVGTSAPKRFRSAKRSHKSYRRKRTKQVAK